MPYHASAHATPKLALSSIIIALVQALAGLGDLEFYRQG